MNGIVTWIACSVALSLCVAAPHPQDEAETVTSPRGIVLDPIDLQARISSLCATDLESETGWRLLRELSALNARDNPTRDRRICDEISNRAAGGEELGWGGEMLLTWVVGDAGIQSIRRLARACSPLTPKHVTRFLIRMLCRLGSDNDRETIARLVASAPANGDADSDPDQLIGMVPVEKDLIGIGVILVPAFAAPGVQGRASVYQALRTLRSWPTTPVDMAIRREAADVLVRAARRDMESVIRIVADSLRVPAECFPGVEDLKQAGETLILKPRYRADTGDGIICGIHMAEPAEFGRAITSGVLDVQQTELMIEVIQEEVGPARTPNYATALYAWITDHWRVLSGERFRRAAMLWIVAASSFVSDRRTEELELLASLDLRELGLHAPARLHDIAQYVRWRFPEELVPELQVHIACGIGCAVTERQVVEIEQLLVDATQKYRFETAERRFLLRTKYGE